MMLEDKLCSYWQRSQHFVCVHIYVFLCLPQKTYWFCELLIWIHNVGIRARHSSSSSFSEQFLGFFYDKWIHSKCWGGGLPLWLWILFIIKTPEENLEIKTLQRREIIWKRKGERLKPKKKLEKPSASNYFSNWWLSFSSWQVSLL